MEDHRRYPLCRLLLYCSACSWARDYNPERIAERLRELHAGGYQAKVGEIAKRVAWNCPACRRMQWVSQLAYRAETDPRQIERAARAIRS